MYFKTLVYNFYIIVGNLSDMSLEDSSSDMEEEGEKWQPPAQAMPSRKDRSVAIIV